MIALWAPAAVTGAVFLALAAAAVMGNSDWLFPAVFVAAALMLLLLAAVIG